MACRCHCCRCRWGWDLWDKCTKKDAENADHVMVSSRRPEMHENGTVQDTRLRHGTDLDEWKKTQNTRGGTRSDDQKYSLASGAPRLRHRLLGLFRHCSLLSVRIARNTS